MSEQTALCAREALPPVSTQEQAVQALESARREVARAKTLSELKRVDGALAATLTWWHKQNDISLAIINDANLLRFEAQARMAAALAGAVRKGERPHLHASHGVTHGAPPTHADLGINREQAKRWREVAATSAEERGRLAMEATAAGKELTQKDVIAAGKGAHVSYNSGNDEWHTPRRIIEMARAVMGGIDCDPASNELANRTVKAGTYYDEQSDGLKQRWHGRVWMNPPYSGALVGKFMASAADRWDRREMEEAIILVNNATETGWFQGLAQRASALCFPGGRVRFLTPEGQPAGTPLQGQAIFYLGAKADRFMEVFGPEGLVLVHG